ncbi:MAG: glycerophosphodiester phosphodiesterase family protein [Pseudomonadota bacterium]
MLPKAFFKRPIAHRALHDRDKGRPENSLEAIDAAIAAGYGIEIDVQMSADGAAFVFHDYDMSRLTGQSGAIQTRQTAEVNAIALLGGQTPAPTLSNVLARINGQVPLLIEIKDQDGAMGPQVGPLENEVARALKDYQGHVAVMSFNPHSVAAFHAACPDLPRGLVSAGFDPFDWPTLPPARAAELAQLSFDPSELDFISHDHTDLDAPRVDKAKAAGLPIFCWTIKSPEEEQRARRVADNVTFEGYLA